MKAHNYTASLQVDGRRRSYLVHPPNSYSPGVRYPLVLVFHGGGGYGQGMTSLAHFNALANTQNFIVVYPNGYHRSWADGRGTTKADQDGVNDVAFIAALLDHLPQSLSIDTRRIYAAGMSNGGFFTARLGCELSNRIAAISIVAATMPTVLAERSRPARPVPVLYFHGSEDRFVPASGGFVTIGAGGSILSITDAVQWWARHNGCRPTPTLTSLPTLVNDGTQVQQTYYQGGQQGANVIYYNIIGGGHTWPGGLQYLPAGIIGKTTRNLDATATSWAFFQDHPLSVR